MEKSKEWAISRKRTRQKEQQDLAETQERGSKAVSNHSLEIPDREEIPDIPRRPPGPLNKAWVGQNIALHALPAEMNCVLLVFAFSVNSTSYIPRPPQSDACLQSV